MRDRAGKACQLVKSVSLSDQTACLTIRAAVTEVGRKHMYPPVGPFRLTETKRGGGEAPRRLTYLREIAKDLCAWPGPSPQARTGPSEMK
jgi:hypothetical protein